VGTPLAQSPQLRQAFEEAIDRQTLNKVVFGGLYLPSCTVIPPANTVWFNLVRVPCTPYDPADARKLVAASGIPNRVSSASRHGSRCRSVRPARSTRRPES
jgi:peptide/nickel transport system substrate-binding protein